MALKASILLALTALLLAAAFFTQPSAAELSIHRVVELHQLHATIYDEIRTSTPAALNLTVAIPPELDGGQLLSIYLLKKGGDCKEPWKLGWLSVQGLNTTAYLVEVEDEATLIYTYLLNTHGLERSLNLTLYPLVDHRVENCTVLVKYPEYTVNVTTLPSLKTDFINYTWISINQTSNLHPMYLAWLSITYRLEKEIGRVVCSNCDRYIHVHPDGPLRIVEKLTFTSIDHGRRVDVIELRLPLKLEQVKVYDHFGPYVFKPQAQLVNPGTYSLTLSNTSLILHLRPRFTLNYHDNVTLTLEYSLPLDSRGSAEIPVKGFANLPVLNLRLYIVPEPGAKLLKSSPIELVDGKVEAHFKWWPPPVEAVEVAYAHTLYIPPSMASLAILFLALGASAVYLLLRPAKPAIPTPPAIPSLEPLIASYERRLALLERQLRLLRGLALGKLRAKAYERQVRSIIFEQSRLEVEVKEHDRKLRSAMPSLSKTLDTLRQLEEQQAKLQGRLKDALARLKAGKTTRREFQEEVAELSSQLGNLLRDFKSALRKLSAKT